jgi:predicted nucleic acid-binding protein
MARAGVSEDRGIAGQDRPRSARARTVRCGSAIVHALGRQSPWRQDAVDSEGLFALMKGIADTGFLVAFANAHDIHHAWAVSLASRVTEPLLTCEAVLAEASFHLQNAKLVLEMVDEGLVTIGFRCLDHLPQLAGLARRYADRAPDLADLCLIRMSEVHPRHSVITVDRDDFRIYRRNKRDVIPIICPPER